MTALPDYGLITARVLRALEPWLRASSAPDRVDGLTPSEATMRALVLTPRYEWWPEDEPEGCRYCGAPRSAPPAGPCPDHPVRRPSDSPQQRELVERILATGGREARELRAFVEMIAAVGCRTNRSQSKQWCRDQMQDARRAQRGEDVRGWGSEGATGAFRDRVAAGEELCIYCRAAEVLSETEGGR